MSGRTGSGTRSRRRCSRAGAALADISQVLRHSDLATTAIYAKVDLGRLRQVARPWPGAATMTALAQHLDEYLQLRRTLGHKLADAHRLLPRFVAYLDEHDAEFVTIEAALAWSLEPEVPVGQCRAGRPDDGRPRVRSLPVRDRPADRGPARGDDPPPDTGGGDRSSTPTTTCSR